MYDSSGSVIKNFCVQYGGLRFELFIFHAHFYPAVIRVFQPHDSQLFGFCNSVAITSLFFKPSKGTAMMDSLCTH